MWIPFLDFLLLTAIFSPISFPLCFLLLCADNVSSSILLYIAKSWCTALSRLPSTAFLRLLGYYSAIRLPVSRLLSCLSVVQHTAYLHSLCGTYWLSPVDMISLYDMTWFSDTAEVYVFSPYRIPSCCFPPSSQRQPSILQSFRCSMACPTALLSTLRTYCHQHEPKTRLWWRG